MNRSIYAPVAPATLTLMEELLARTSAANAVDDYVAADYDLPANALMALLVDAFGVDHAVIVRECTYDGCTVAHSIEVARRHVRVTLADAYDTATVQQAERDALAAFDAVVAGEGDVAAHLRTFAAATDHLASIGAGLNLGGEWVDRDTTDARMVAAANLATVTA